MTKIVDYGFSWQMIGHKCYVTNVEAGSDAEAKGLKVGDVITGFENYSPTRENVWLMTYVWYRLDPRLGLKVFVEVPGGGEREISIDSKLTDTNEVLRNRPSTPPKPYRCEELSAEVIACKLYTFSTDPPMIDEMMKQVRKSKKLILDLRGNGGGHVATELHLTGYFFSQNVKVADEKRRDDTEERFAKTHKNKVFTGDLVVLIDSKSMSASEVFARVIQLEKRGKIVGDISAGRVRTSLLFHLLASDDVPFGLSVTIADLTMSDGKSLERVGVIPDKAIGPTAAALASGNDPVLAYAAGMFNVQLTAAAAGKLNFLNPWRREQ
jgi:C-terminal processing protease CtpA/Prc